MSFLYGLYINNWGSGKICYAGITNTMKNKICGFTVFLIWLLAVCVREASACVSLHMYFELKYFFQSQHHDHIKCQGQNRLNTGARNGHIL